MRTSSPIRSKNAAQPKTIPAIAPAERDTSVNKQIICILLIHNTIDVATYHNSNQVYFNLIIRQPKFTKQLYEDNELIINTPITN